MFRHSWLHLSAFLAAAIDLPSSAAPPSLLSLAADWAKAAIFTIETEGGPQKLARAATSFGEELAKRLNTLEARAGVLGGFLNSAGADAIEHVAILRALEAGGPALHTLYERVVQGVFDQLRKVGRI